MLPCTYTRFRQRTTSRSLTLVAATPTVPYPARASPLGARARAPAMGTGTQQADGAGALAFQSAPPPQWRARVRVLTLRALLPRSIIQGDAAELLRWLDTLDTEQRRSPSAAALRRTAGCAPGRSRAASRCSIVARLRKGRLRCRSRMRARSARSKLTRETIPQPAAKLRPRKNEP